MESIGAFSPENSAERNRLEKIEQEVTASIKQFIKELDDSDVALESVVASPSNNPFMVDGTIVAINLLYKKEPQPLEFEDFTAHDLELVHEWYERVKE